MDNKDCQREKHPATKRQGGKTMKKVWAAVEDAAGNK